MNMDGDDILKYVIKCRKSLMSKCSRKVDSAFPKLLISKLDSSRAGISRSAIAAVGQVNDNDSEVGDWNPSSSHACSSPASPIALEVEAEIKAEINDARAVPETFSNHQEDDDSLPVLRELLFGGVPTMDSTLLANLETDVSTEIIIETHTSTTEPKSLKRKLCDYDQSPPPTIQVAPVQNQTSTGSSTMDKEGECSNTQIGLLVPCLMNTDEEAEEPPTIFSSVEKLVKGEEDCGRMESVFDPETGILMPNFIMENFHQEPKTSHESSQASVNVVGADVNLANSRLSDENEGDSEAHHHPSSDNDRINETPSVPTDPIYSDNSNDSKAEVTSNHVAAEESPAPPLPINLKISPFKSTDVSVPGRRSGLRNTHRCQKCQKTFTSAEKLQSHVEKDHHSDRLQGEDDNDDDPTSESSNDDEVIADDASFCMESSSSESGVDEDDNADGSSCSDKDERRLKKLDVVTSALKVGTASDSTTATPEVVASSSNFLQTNSGSHAVDGRPSSLKPKTKRTKKYRQIREPGRPSKLKCPDCSLLLANVRRLLTHRKDSKTCSASYDPTTSIRIEVFSQPVVEKTDDKNKKLMKGSPDDFTLKIAEIDLPQGIFICEKCGLAVYSPEDIEEHNKLHGSFPCKFCNAKISYAPDLPQHELKHSKKSEDDDDGAVKKISLKLPCSRCDSQFHLYQKRNGAYVQHFLKSHLSLSTKLLDEPICAICKTNPNYVGKLEIGKHFKSHHDLTHITDPRDLVKCSAAANCTAYFLTMQQLNDHLRLRHGIVNLPRDIPGEKNAVKHQCKDCEKSFFKLVDLRKHRLRKHIGWEEKIPCTFAKCKKVFESQTHLERHLKHSSDFHTSLEEEKQVQSVQCPKCKKFINGRRPAYLRMHLEQHKEDRICEICGKVFKSNNHLNVHRLSHSGPESWEFMCSICSKKCISRGKLDEHMRTHTKVKPFVCEICGVKYAHRHNLRIHVNNKHGDQVEDKSREFTRRNITSRKGIKRKKVERDEEEEDYLTETDSD